MVFHGFSTFFPCFCWSLVPFPEAEAAPPPPSPSATKRRKEAVRLAQQEMEAEVCGRFGFLGFLYFLYIVFLFKHKLSNCFLYGLVGLVWDFGL